MCTAQKHDFSMLQHAVPSTLQSATTPQQACRHTISQSALHPHKQQRYQGPAGDNHPNPSPAGPAGHALNQCPGLPPPSSLPAAAPAAPASVNCAQSFLVLVFVLIICTYWHPKLGACIIIRLQAAGGTRAAPQTTGLGHQQTAAAALPIFATPAPQEASPGPQQQQQ